MKIRMNQKEAHSLDLRIILSQLLCILQSCHQAKVVDSCLQKFAQEQYESSDSN